MSFPRLGRRPPHPPEHPHHLRLARYLAPGLVPAPSVAPNPLAVFDPYENNAIGDCACAAPANLVRALRPEHLLPLAAVLAAYTTCGGYDPADPTTDNGCIISDVLALWSCVGAGGIGGDVLAAFAEVDHSTPRLLELAVTLFGAAIIGVSLPLAAQGASSWETPANLAGDNAPGSWGGHCVPVVGYDASGAWVVSWGTLMHASWGWLAAYQDEAWAVVSGDYVAPPGVDLVQLRADLAQIKDVS